MPVYLSPAITGGALNAEQKACDGNGDGSVDSWPPCMLVVEVKTAAGLSIMAPLSHREDV